MKVQHIIKDKLQVFSPLHLEVINESGQHASGPNAETHFKILLVSEAWEGVSMIARHRKVFSVLAEEQTKGVHALSLHLWTTKEWKERGGELPESPACRGGSS